MAQKLLLIDDDQSMISLLKTILKFEGYEVAMPGEPSNIDEIIQWIRLEQPALIMLDVHLTSFDGFELLRSIRQESDIARIPVLVSSGMDYRQKCKDEGADGFLLKPYMPEELITKIKSIIGENINSAGGR